MQQDELVLTEGMEALVLPIPDADIRYFDSFIPLPQACQLLDSLQRSLAWRQDHIRLYGRLVKIPRLQAWYGDKNASYTYSGLEMKPLPWTKELLLLKDYCEQASGATFNGVLANLYRNGQDSMGMHADDEVELGKEPTIASVSLGQMRNLDFKHRYSGQNYRLPLAHGSLLLMAGKTQKYWRHGIAKSRKDLGLRINLTFRLIR